MSQTRLNQLWCYWQLLVELVNKKKFLLFSLILFTFFAQNLAATSENIIEYESELKNGGDNAKPNSMSLWQQKELEGVSKTHQDLMLNYFCE